jgi:hypothetical protein
MGNPAHTMTALTYLRHALAVRALSRDGEDIYGSALTVIRADAADGVHDDVIGEREARGVYDEIMAVGVADMPPPTDLVAILLETLGQRLGGASHGMAWQHIGINPNRGRGLLGRNAHAVDWPIWYTLREAALNDPVKRINNRP